MKEFIQPYVCRELSAEEIRNEPHWQARLSDQSTVYSKVGHQSWLQLKSWLKENPSVFITGLWFCFRDHSEEVVIGPHDGYFLSHGVQAWHGTDITQQLLIGGYLKENTVYRKKYILPEIVFQEEDNFPANTPEMQRGLILRGKQTSV